MPPKRARLRLPARILLSVAAIALTWLVAEGVHALVLDRSLLWSRLRPPLLPGPMPRTAAKDEERIAAAATTAGPHALDVDPFVGGRLKGSSERAIFDVPYATDRFGHRRRAGPPPKAGAFRIVVLGDSVAFGYGVKDDETFGHAIEEALGAAMEPRRPKPVVQTIACPGWSWSSERRYLLDHLARLAPDLVVLVPVENDFDDPWAVNEAGHSEMERDPARGGAVPRLSTQAFLALVTAAQAVMPAARQREMAAAGKIEVIAPALAIGFAPESRRRWDAMMREVGDLDDRLRARGAHLTVASYFESEFTSIYRTELEQARPGIDVQSLFGEGSAGDTLGHDAHQNARCLRNAGRELARRLAEAGRVPGARPDQVPPVEEAYASRRARLTIEEARRQAAALRATALRFTGPVIDLRDATGFQQIYGGVGPDATVGVGFLASLRNDPPGAGTVELMVGTLARKSALYPLEVTATVNGIPAGSAVVAPPEGDGEGVAEVSFAIPDGVRGAPWIDVAVTPSNWIAEPKLGTTRLAAFKLVRLALR